MKKILLILFALLMMVGCGTNSEPSHVSVLAPTGAPAISLVSTIENENHEVELVSGPENLQAALVNPNAEYDVIIAPLNLGANLINQDKTEYKLHSIISWGNLFIVSRSDEINSIALFGEAAVPGLVFKAVESGLNLDNAEQTWVPSVSEAQVQLLSDNVDAALLAQPLVAATMAKAKQEGIELSISHNLQEVYNQHFGVNSYPQAAIFVKESSDSVNGVIDQMKQDLDSVKSDQETFLKQVDTIGTDVLGIPSGQLVVNAFDQMGLDIKEASSVKAEIDAFLNLFNLELSDEAIVE